MGFSFKLLQVAALLFFALGVAADAWIPPIITPNKATIWCIGSTATATWNTSKPPAQITSPTGTFFLGHSNSDGSGGDNLDVGHPLVRGFRLDQGKVSFEVPYVAPNNNYLVVLVGSTRNISPEFTITQCTRASAQSHTQFTQTNTSAPQRGVDPVQRKFETTRYVLWSRTASLMGYSNKEWKKSIQLTGKVLLLVIVGFTCFASLLSRLWSVYSFFSNSFSVPEPC